MPKGFDGSKLFEDIQVFRLFAKGEKPDAGASAGLR
jgi:hypothetical protein